MTKTFFSSGLFLDVFCYLFLFFSKKKKTHDRAVCAGLFPWKKKKRYACRHGCARALDPLFSDVEFFFRKDKEAARLIRSRLEGLADDAQNTQQTKSVEGQGQG
nr:hypothetical protein [Pandoravirus aubagnensis]